MIAWKFLAPGGVAPFSGAVWPVPAAGRPGEWLAAEPSPCASGIHACRIRHLAYWLGPELWEVELAGGVTETESKLVAPRGRLLRRVEAWNDEARAAFVRACVDRARTFAAGRPQLAAYERDLEGVAAMGPGLIGYAAARMREEAEGPRAFALERAWQGEWLGRLLGLGDCGRGMLT